MFRLGIYTGRRYPAETEAESIGECCFTVADDGPVDDDILNRLYANRRSHCAGCKGCREAESDSH